MDCGLVCKVPELYHGTTNSPTLLKKLVFFSLKTMSVEFFHSLSQQLSVPLVWPKLVLLGVFRGFKGFVVWTREKVWPWGGSSAQTFIWGHCSDRFACRGNCSQQETFQRPLGMEVTTQKGKRAKELPGERGRTEIGDVSWWGWECDAKDFWRVCTNLGSLSSLWPADVGHCLKSRQALKWLKSCIFGLSVKQLYT